MLRGSWSNSLALSGCLLYFLATSKEINGLLFFFSLEMRPHDLLNLLYCVHKLLGCDRSLPSLEAIHEIKKLAYSLLQTVHLMRSILQVGLHILRFHISQRGPVIRVQLEGALMTEESLMLAAKHLRLCCLMRIAVNPKHIRSHSQTAYVLPELFWDSQLFLVVRASYGGLFRFK